ncbi:hypothetical protein [Actinokineospora terrae]|uniref:Peptidase inhibitor family I36 n=1 Tax=Actinokineospora terrae TaxID=155974 RepID=A0A1H9XGQ1_9PSEU|nr:hypothetical protein [Actinokineospora terrae]SES45315.1 hypothetical protein SAMN04487818_11560 [Actinokineospora terrae]
MSRRMTGAVLVAVSAAMVVGAPAQASTTSPSACRWTWVYQVTDPAGANTYSRSGQLLDHADRYDLINVTEKDTRYYGINIRTDVWGGINPTQLTYTGTSGCFPLD